MGLLDSDYMPSSAVGFVPILVCCEEQAARYSHGAENTLMCNCGKLCEQILGLRRVLW